MAGPFSDARRLWRLVGAAVLMVLCGLSFRLAFALFSHRAELSSVDPTMVVFILIVAAAISGFGGVVLFLGAVRD